jgi:hypothetical protein
MQKYRKLVAIGDSGASNGYFFIKKINHLVMSIMQAVFHAA